MATIIIHFVWLLVLLLLLLMAAHLGSEPLSLLQYRTSSVGAHTDPDTAKSTVYYPRW